MVALITADVHLTDNPRDEYRWGLFPWLRKQSIKNGGCPLLILGDLTDAKDKHSAVLVNRICEAFRSYPGKIYLLKGNHDYIDPANPFFQFTDDIPNVVYMGEPAPYHLTNIGECLFLPSTGDYEKDWAEYDFTQYDFIFTHQTYDGCESENGTLLPGIPLDVFGDSEAKVYSGDIHVPQQLGKRLKGSMAASGERQIEYVGAPYRVRFGDRFEPRVLLVDRISKTVLRFPCMMKHTLEINSPSDLPDVDRDGESIYPCDQVKVRVKLARADYPEWPKIKDEIKAWAKKSSVELFGPELLALQDKKKRPRLGEDEKVNRKSPRQYVEEYSVNASLTQDTLKYGLGLIGEI